MCYIMGGGPRGVGGIWSKGESEEAGVGASEGEGEGLSPPECAAVGLGVVAGQTSVGPTSGVSSLVACSG